MKKKPAGSPPVGQNEYELQRLVHELQVYQMELEMQNEELRTARNEVEAGLERYTDLYDFAPVGYFTLSANGLVRQVNLSGARLLNIERANMVGKRFDDYVSPHDRPLFVDFLQKTLTSQAKQISQLALIHAGVSALWVQIEAVAKGDGEEIRLVINDITERKQIEDTLLFLAQRGWINSGEDFFYALARFLADTLNMDYVCIDRLDPDGLAAQTVAIYFDGKFDDNVRYSLKDTPCGEVAGKVVCCFPRRVRHLFPQDIVLQDMLAESFAGTTLWSSTGKPIGLIAVIGRRSMDDTQVAESILKLVSVRAAGEIERRESEHALQEERSLLSQRVAERTAELRQMNLKLVLANQTKDEFLANMSHELRTPFNGILTLAESLQELTYGDIPDRQMHAIHTIEASGQHLLSLINDILDLSKMEAGKLIIQPAPISVLEICSASLAIAREPAMKKHLTMKFDCPDQPLFFLADPLRVKQILVNFLSNAVKFTPEGGEVTLRVVPDDDLHVIHFSVTDTGIGISAHDQQRLFQPFTQIDSGLNRMNEGTGLGLALCKRLSDLHGGNITVESQVNVGSCFTVSLPWLHPGQDESSGSLNLALHPNDL